MGMTVIVILTKVLKNKPISNDIKLQLMKELVWQLGRTGVMPVH